MAQPGARRPPPPPVAQQQRQFSPQPQLAHNKQASAALSGSDFHSLQNSPTSSLASPHHHPHHHSPHHHHHQRTTTTTTTTTGQNVGGGSHTKAADALALAAQAGVKPGNYRGHQRRQSVARLLPDISKLRLLSWLVEASNELINCDIAIMDGVYAKLNRSRESLLFWQSREPQTSAASSAGQTSNRSRPVPPPRPPPPSVMPPMAVGSNKAVISNNKQQQRQQLVKQQAPTLALGNQHQASGRSKAGPGSHHSLPLANYDASSLAALSMRSSKTIPSTSGGGTQSAAANSIDAMISRHAAGQPSGTPKPAARNNRSLALSLLASNSDNAQQQQQQQTNVNSSICCDEPNTRQVNSDDDDHDDDDNEEEDDDGESSSSSSAASSTTSSGIHETSSSSETSSADSSTSGDSSCSFDVEVPPPAEPAKSQQQISSAEQLSERIRRAVMEHNYLQNLLVNVIRQHDRRRELLERQRRHQMILVRQHGRSLGSSGGGGQLVLPRIDLADIADALDDGCQCSCHSQVSSSSSSQSSRHHSICGNSPAPSLLGGGTGQRASTLPTSSSLSLSSSGATRANTQQTTSGGRHLLVPSRKNRRKKNSEPSREDIIQRLADKLCESCFETHYWLHSCHSSAGNSSSALAADLTPLLEQQQQVDTSGGTASDSKVRDQSLGGGGGGGASVTSKEQQNNLDAVISLRNATFIKLVQQQVRSTISNSIELIDLIRKEIKSPESIKQKQLMRGFSASIQLLSSVAGYVVPSQDISTFIQADTGPVGGAGIGGSSGIGIGNNQRFFDQTTRDQQTQLFNLPPGDFDHLLLHAALSSSSSSSTNSSHYPYGGSPTTATQPKSNYHLAQAPEIPIRRRYNTLLAQRRSSDETNSLPAPSSDHSTDAFRSLPPNASIGNTRGCNSRSSFGAGSCDTSGKRTSTTSGPASTNPNGDESSSGASSNNSSASSSIARNQVGQQQQQHPSLTKAHTSSAILDGKTSHDLSFEAMANLSHHHHHHDQADDDLAGFGSGSNRGKFWQSSKFNFIKKLLQVKQQRLLRQQSKDRRIYNNKVANKFRLVMMDLTHFNRSQQLLATENGVNSLLTSMRNVLEFGLYLTVKLY